MKKGQFITLLGVVILIGGAIFAFVYIKLDKINVADNNSNDLNSEINITEETLDNEKIETAIKMALVKNIAENEGIISVDDNSILAEGHKTLRTEIKDDKINAYVLASIGIYTETDDLIPEYKKQFEIQIPEKNVTYLMGQSMQGPFVIVFTKNYEFTSYNIPSDGMGWNESLKELFPDDLLEEATGVDYGTDFFKNQIKSYLN